MAVGPSLNSLRFTRSSPTLRPRSKASSTKCSRLPQLNRPREPMNTELTRPGELGDGAFKALIRDAPLVSIDLVVRTKAGRYLLGFRKNRPAKGSYFVLGGRIWKDETIDQAFQYITKNELGIQKELGDAIFLGVFTHRYED